MYTLIFVLFIYMYIYKFFKKKNMYHYILSHFRCAPGVSAFRFFSIRSPKEAALTAAAPSAAPWLWGVLCEAREGSLGAGGSRGELWMVWFQRKNMIKLENKRVQGWSKQNETFCFFCAIHCHEDSSGICFFANKHAEFANMMST